MIRKNCGMILAVRDTHAVGRYKQWVSVMGERSNREVAVAEMLLSTLYHVSIFGGPATAGAASVSRSMVLWFSQIQRR